MGIRINSERIIKVANALIALNFKNILKFDLNEPKYLKFTFLKNKVKDPKYLFLIGICAGINDYQLGTGRAQKFWRTLKDIIIQNINLLDSINSLNEIMLQFLEKPINALYNDQKKFRLKRLFNNNFPNWFRVN
ncbi:MAG: hypothetical protein ACTSRG_03395 [Candidatus Helarchaeota archaeon]